MTSPSAGITVLGLDPGTRHFGWGVVERRGTRIIHVAHGIVHTDEKTSIAGATSTSGGGESGDSTSSSGSNGGGGGMGC